MSASHAVRSPSSIANPTTRWCSARMRPARPTIHSMFGSRSSACLTHAPYCFLSAWARGDHTAGPRLLIEQLELDAGRIDSDAHQTAQCIDLSNQVSLRRSADRRIARHMRDSVGRERAQADVHAQSCRCKCRFTTRVARADHDDIEAVTHATSNRATKPSRRRSLDGTCHFPIQKREKIWASTSSGVRRPETSSSATRAA